MRMRTTLTLDEDVAAAVRELRQQDGVGVSEAINRLARAGLSKPRKRALYHHRTMDIGIKIDVANIGEVLELLDQA